MVGLQYVVFRVFVTTIECRHRPTGHSFIPLEKQHSMITTGTDTVMDPTMDKKINKWKEKVWNGEEPNPSFTSSYSFSNMVEDSRKSLRKDRRVSALVPSSPMGPAHPAETLVSDISV